MKMRKSYLFYGIGLISTIFFTCEIAIYYFSIQFCSWPARLNSNEDSLKVMIIADTHLLGPHRGHPFDKLRREWQMERSFKTAFNQFTPELVIFLGDLFDEGLIVSNKYFNEDYVQRFESIFQVPQTTNVLVVPGNHDIGFHNEISFQRESRFNEAFNSTPVSLYREKNVSFILLNSMAMDDDGCTLCDKAKRNIRKISEQLNCDKDMSRCSNEEQRLKRSPYSKPILLQHFPLYRVSDSICSGQDSAPEPEKNFPFRPKLDCLTKQASSFLLNNFNPRLILSGHTHHGCLIYHKTTTSTTTSTTSNNNNNNNQEKDVPEYSLPSFNWRNRNDPSFFLGLFTHDEYELEKCYLPRESLVINLYIFGAVSSALLLIYSFLR